MKKVVLVIFLAVAWFGFTWGSPALAADAGAGKQVFAANCAACHMGGRNIVMAQKTLKKDALEKYDMYSMEKIVSQVTNGKGAMPRFGGKLTAEQIDNVAAYVLDKADNGW